MDKIVYGNSVRVYKDEKYRFIEYFSEKTGLLIRSNIFDGNIDTGREPFMRSFPELLDIGIMGSCHISNKNICKAAGIDCYQNAISKIKPNMGIDDYKEIMKQCEGRVFQVALGGAGDPNKHENFEEILLLTRETEIVPNLTTSGIGLTDREISLIREYCGAVAVSYYSRLEFDSNNSSRETNMATIDAIERLVAKNCIVNIHFVLSTDTIQEAITRLRYGLFPKGINAVIFILYKPVGLGRQEKVLSLNNLHFIGFLELINVQKFDFKVGFDTCHTPALVNKCSNISEQSLDACEAARFSMYIDRDLIAYPCSFDCIGQEFAENLRIKTIDKVWWSDTFNCFRDRQNNACNQCEKKGLCMGGCLLGIDLDICGQKR